MSFRKDYVKAELLKTDLLANADPKVGAKLSKLSWLWSIIFVAIWPKVKPWILEQVGQALTDKIEKLLEGI